MSDNRKPTYSVNEYDQDGDIGEHGIYLHFGDIRIKIGTHSDDLRFLAENILDCVKEIEEN